MLRIFKCIIFKLLKLQVVASRKKLLILDILFNIFEFSAFSENKSISFAFMSSRLCLKTTEIHWPKTLILLFWLTLFILNLS